jgi:hypothetical protein
LVENSISDEAAMSAQCQNNCDNANEIDMESNSRMDDAPEMVDVTVDLTRKDSNIKQIGIILIFSGDDFLKKSNILLILISCFFGSGGCSTTSTFLFLRQVKMLLLLPVSMNQRQVPQEKIGNKD